MRRAVDVGDFTTITTITTICPSSVVSWLIPMDASSTYLSLSRYIISRSVAGT